MIFLECYWGLTDWLTECMSVGVQWRYTHTHTHLNSVSVTVWIVSCATHCLPASQLACLLMFCCCYCCCLPNLYDVYSTSNVAVKSYTLCLPPPLFKRYAMLYAICHAMPCYAIPCIVCDPYTFIRFVHSLNVYLLTLSNTHACIHSARRHF